MEKKKESNAFKIKKDIFLYIFEIFIIKFIYLFTWLCISPGAYTNCHPG